MDILYISNLYPPSIGGSQVHLHRLAKTMQSNGNRVSVITMTTRPRTDWLRLSTVLSEKESRFVYEGIDVWKIGFSARTRLHMAPWALLYYAFMGVSVRRIAALMSQQVEQGTPVPAIVHATRNGREFLARAALDFAHRQNIPFVLTPNHHPRWKGFLYREYTRIYREADALIALTAAEKETLVAECGVREDRVHITGIGPLLSEEHSEETFRTRFGLKERFVLFLGQQLQYKGIQAILQAAPLVWREHPEIRFVFIGPRTSYSRSLFKTVTDPRVSNIGPVDLETKTSALAACDLLCLPSSQESFGGVFVEAWAFRKPVIGGRIGPIASVIDEGKDGLLSSQDPAELARLISSLLSDPVTCRVMGGAGWKKVQARYSWEKIADKTYGIYRSLRGGDEESPERGEVS